MECEYWCMRAEFGWILIAPHRMQTPLVVVEAAACQGLCVWEFEGEFRI